MSKASTMVKDELLKLIPPTVFFFIALNLVALVRSLMLEGTGIQVGGFLSVTVAALVLGKSVLIADMLPAVNRFPTKPLMYNVAWKSIIYIVVATFIHYLERLYDFWRETGGFAAGNEKLLDTMVWSQFWAVHIFLCVLIFSYCVMHELSRVLGKQEMRRLFFGTPASQRR